VACCCLSLASCGDFLDSRREGVKNSLLFLGFVGVSSVFGGICSEVDRSVDSSAGRRLIVPDMEGEVDSMVEPVVDAKMSNGGGLCEEDVAIEVDTG